MKKSTINFSIELDQQNVPDKIFWDATEKPEHGLSETKAIAIALWDQTQKNTLRIDLWTKDMLVGEMKRFFLQSLGGMNETLQSATNDDDWFNEVEATIKKLAERLQKEEADGKN